MRWVAAFLVFIYHAGTRHVFLNSDVDNSFATLTSKAGWTGVSFFFVLSGFVLTWSARPGDTLRAFSRRRVAKIYPNHVVTWVAALALILWSGPLLAGPILWPAAVANLLLVHAWVPDPDYFTCVNGVSWSLSCEVLFYLMFPLWLVLVRRIAPVRLWCWAGGIIILIFCIPFLAELLPAKPLLPWKKPLPTYRYWFVYIFPPVRMLEFILGMVIARAVEEERRWVRLSMAQAAMLCCVGYAAALLAPSSKAFVAYVGQDSALLLGIAAMTVLPIALVIAAGAQADLRGVQSLLRHRAMILLGEVSFAFYLVHRLVLVYGHQALGSHRQWPAAAAVALIVLALAISIALAALLYKIVEVPMMDRFSGSKRRSDGPRSEGSTAKEETPLTSPG
jgi:peptidoglycan/LPS O-acetylase OafA/YrhL